MVDLSFDETSKAWSQRVIFQVCKGESEALRSPYGLSKPREGQEDTKRNLELVLENEEVISFTHNAESRDIFAYGAIEAALWLLKQDPGYYELENVN